MKPLLLACPRRILMNWRPATALLKCSWDDLIVDTHGHLANMVDLPPAALAVIRRDLWAMVAEAIDTNAEVDVKERAVLTRTDLVARTNDIVQLVDLQSIEYVLTEGLCSLIDTQPVATGDGYYEGISTQPGPCRCWPCRPRDPTWLNG